ncbi:hypothetical protein DSECCO2_616470 [anaerobic digester metagenome]
MDREGVKRLIILPAEPPDHRPVAEDSRDPTNQDRGGDRDEPGSGGNRDEPSHRARDHAEGCGAAIEPGDEEPGHRTGGGGDVGDQECVRRYAIGREGGPGVEPEPAEPEEPAAEQGHRDIVGLHRVLPEPDPLPDHEGEGEGREARVYLDHGAAGEVQEAKGLGPTPAPGPVGEGVVDERGPEEPEHEERAQSHPFGDSGGDDGERHRGKREVERGEEDRRIGPVPRVQADSREPEMLEPPDEAADVVTEDERVADKDPLEAHERERNERERDHRDEVLLPHHPPVEEPDPGRHQDHKRGRDKQPRRRPRIEGHLPAHPVPALRIFFHPLRFLPAPVHAVPAILRKNFCSMIFKK